MANDKDEKKGFGPALAAMILAIIAFVITGIVALVFSGLKDFVADVITEVISSEFPEHSAIPAEELNAALDILKLTFKLAFGAIHFSGGLFMLISFICDIVAICKYYGNKTETKAASTIVLAYIGLAFLVAAVVIAVMGINSISGMIDQLIAPYYA